VAEIHDRMPLILAAADYSRWLSDEPDPRDLLQPFPAEPMRMWPISTRVNKPENDDPSMPRSATDKWMAAIHPRFVAARRAWLFRRHDLADARRFNVGFGLLIGLIK
jgi:hypothetical protein